MNPRFQFGDIVQADASGRYVLMANRRYMVVAPVRQGVPARLLPLFETGNQAHLIKLETMVGLEIVERLA